MLRKSYVLAWLFGLGLFFGSSGCDTQAGGGNTPQMGQTDQMVTIVSNFAQQVGDHLPITSPNGFFASVSSSGSIDSSNLFFQSLGSNGRRCVSCHAPFTGWTITPKFTTLFFKLCNGGVGEANDTDTSGFCAIFRTNDGSNSPNADLSTLGKRKKAFSMLLTKGLIRVGLPIPAGAEFALDAVDDPYHFASAAELSLFRRPLPTANLKFDSTIMWDGRENKLRANTSAPDPTGIAGPSSATDIQGMLTRQANDATRGHAQATRDLTPDEVNSIVNFQLGITAGQVIADGNDLADGANGGPDALQAQEFYVGINDNLGDSRTLAPFSPVVFTSFDGWQNAVKDDTDPNSAPDENKRAVYRGQVVFNTLQFDIAGVGGLNDNPVFGSPAVIHGGTCTTCHDTPNAGNHSVAAPLNIGLVGEDQRTPDMPLYTLRNLTTGELVKVTDPGRALVTGKWIDVGKFKGPMLRNLAVRGPYFHNGSRETLEDVVDFYIGRFNIVMSAQQRSDLLAFLRST
ncbi:MAG TPA: hypothetical protein VLK22_04295 [Candidatus Udaeobacter sp.]|nr:hypothetical protein [Candidatus Udaeobacter sp.]